MTEQKKDYMIDALGELEDSYIEEAVNYVKGRFTWRYGKELGVLAACVAVVFLSVSAYHILPFKGATDNATGAPESMEIVKEEQVIEGVTAEGIAPETAPENSALSGKLENNTAVGNEGVTQDTSTEDTIREYASKGIQWEKIESDGVQQSGVMDMEKGKEMDHIYQSIGGGYNYQESTTSEAMLVRLSEEEIFQRNTDIFRGTVIDMEVYHVTGGMDTYFRVATVEVEESIRGDLKVGDTCRIYVPLGSSVNGDLDKLESGSRAIFMPLKATTETRYSTKDEVWLCYADFAEYYSDAGVYSLFLETEDGVSYAKDLYEIESEGKVTLEDVAEYIREMLK